MPVKRDSKILVYGRDYDDDDDGNDLKASQNTKKKKNSTDFLSFCGEGHRIAVPISVQS